MDAAAGPERVRVVVHGRARARTTLRFGTAVTCPSFRYHPAVVAQAAATLGAMYPDRFWLGLGAGEALNEHVVGGSRPEVGVRSAMMFEAIEIINKLFTGKVVRHKGEHFTLESAKLYTLPERPVPIYVATAGPLNAKRTGRLADGMITVGAADEKLKELWENNRPRGSRGWQGPHDTPKLLPDRTSAGRVRTRKPPTSRSRNGRTAGWPSPNRTSATPRTSPRWRSSSGRRTSSTGCSSAPTSTATSRTSSTTSTSGSTRSTCITSAGTSRSSSRSSARRSCRIPAARLKESGSGETRRDGNRHYEDPPNYADEHIGFRVVSP